jgi:hypothetical protein
MEPKMGQRSPFSSLKKKRKSSVGVNRILCIPKNLVTLTQQEEDENQNRANLVKTVKFKEIKSEQINSN